ncbi:MAG: altronate dehydratase, partial [Clostridiales bacterium]|nr:altronate dehydratase [Clostridiales bacterium]
MRAVLKITPSDNVAVALRALEAGETVEVEGVAYTAKQPVPAGHKMALAAIAAGETIIKYGYPIGEAKSDIDVGEHVHVHNLHTLLSGELTYEWHPKGQPLVPVEARTFPGYRRADGRVGVRNELWILPTVGCVSGIAKALERQAQVLVGEGVEA